MRPRLMRVLLRVQLVGLVLLLSGGIGIALEAGIPPNFEGQYTLYGQQMLTVHYGAIGMSIHKDTRCPSKPRRRGVRLSHGIATDCYLTWAFSTMRAHKSI
jgi:hypothetical protein